MDNNVLEFLKIQINFNNNVLSKNIDGISNAEALIFPNGDVNCANWVLGHLIFVRNALIKILGGNPVWNDEDFSFYNRGAKPLEHINQYADFDKLKSYLVDTELELNRVLENKKKH